MKIFKFVVASNAKSVGLFPVVTPPGLYAGWDRETLRASFDDEPVLFRFSHARFIVREMRRSGYYVSLRPYVLVMMRGFLLCIRSRLIRRQAAKATWRK